MIVNTRQSYGLVAQLLHWATALLILGLLLLGLYMTGLPQGSAEEVAEKAWLFSLHKTLGVSVFFVAVLRVAWAFAQPRPTPLNADRKLESLAAHSVHWILYISIICMPLTGWLHHSASEGFAPIWLPGVGDLPHIPKNVALAEFFSKAHTGVALLLGAAVAFHSAGAFKHFFFDQDLTLQRMIPGYSFHSKETTSEEPADKKRPALIAVLIYGVLVGALGADWAFTQSKPDEHGIVLEQKSAAPTSWRVDPERSSIDIQIMQMGSPVNGRFDNWNAAIVLDPNDLALARIEVEVDTASISLGGVSDQAKGENFLNAVQFPIARFVSQDVRQLSDGSYETEGQLTLAGREHPATLPFTLRIEEGRAHATAELTIKRLEFGIGEIGFTKDDQLGFDVLVTVTLEADQSQPTGPTS